MRRSSCPPRAWTARTQPARFREGKALHQQAIFDRPVALIFDGLCHLLAMVLGSARPAERGIFRTGEAAMAKVLNEILLFSSMAVFVTGIVLAAARLLI